MVSTCYKKYLNLKDKPDIGKLLSDRNINFEITEKLNKVFRTSKKKLKTLQEKQKQE